MYDASQRPVSDDPIGHEMIGWVKFMIESAKLLMGEAMRLSLANTFVF